jgi:hypothetical protein
MIKEFGVDQGVIASEHLDAYLIELTIASLLGTLATGTSVRGRRAGHSAHSAPDPLRYARTTPAVASGRNVALESSRSTNEVHLLLDDVRRLASDRANKSVRSRMGSRISPNP